MNFIRKWLSAPSGEQVTLPSVELWYVRWYRRYGAWNGDTEPVMEAFTDRESAVHFKKELEAAFKLIRHTSGTHVTIERG